MPKTKVSKGKSNSEIQQLRERLTAAHRHRDLLIEALHGVAASRGMVAPMGAAAVSKPDLGAVMDWLIAEIGKLTATRPILGMSTLTALMVPIPRLTKEINSKWFPNGGGFPSIAGSTTVGNLGYAIWLHA
jgi:hypothetical protein